MKTAISIPDDTFERASRRALDLGISRSEFFTTAARHYLAELDAEAIGRQIDEAAEVINGAAADAVEAGRATLIATADDW